MARCKCRCSPLSLLVLAAAVLFTVLAVASNAAALSTDYWLDHDCHKNGYHMGIWRNCTGCDTESCKDDHYDPGQIFPIRILLLLAPFLCLAVVPLSICGYAARNMCSLLVAMVLALIQAALVITAMLLFTYLYGVKMRNHKDYSWSYIVGWITVALYLAGAVGWLFAVLVQRRHSQSRRRMYSPIN